MKPTALFIILILIEHGILFGQTDQTIENLYTFNKLYGYVKYFYPGDEAAAMDWDKFAIYGCNRVEACKNRDELKTILNNLFLPVVPTLKIFNTGENIAFDISEISPPDAKKYKIIAWQYLGIGFGNRDNVYKSARTNRPVTYTSSGYWFGTITHSLDAVKHKGKEFIYKASVRMVGGTGTGHLWARVDKENGTMGFFDNMDDRPVVSHNWTHYEIRGKIDSAARLLVFGCFLSGEGQLLLDNIEILIMENNKSVTVYSSGFEEDKNNLYPESMGSKKNRDRARQSGYEITVVQTETPQGKQCVKIESTSNPVVEKNHRQLFKRHAAIGEHIRKDIGSGLSCIMPVALYGNNENTYPKPDIAALDKLKKSTQSIPDSSLNGTNLYLRLGDIVITWNIFQHFYPYFDVAKTDWDNDFREAIRDAYNAKTGYDFKKTLEKFTAKLKDGHIGVSSFAHQPEEGYWLPLEWEWVEGKLVITAVYNDSLPVKKGEIVLSIDGQSPEEYFNNVRQYISAATKGWLDYCANANSLLGRKNSVVTLSLQKDNGSNYNAKILRNIKYFDYRKLSTDEKSIKKLSDGTWYINIGVASMKEINEVMPELAKATGIICDLRGYPNSNDDFIRHLLLIKDTSSHWMQVPEIIYPDQENVSGYRYFRWYLKPKKPHLTAKMIFIIDGRAISYAESYMGFIENYKLATIVGQPTAGTNGNINPFNLPGGYKIFWTGMKVVKHNGSQHHGVGILPNIYVEKTIQGIRENRDEFLEKAIQVLNKKQ